MEEEDHFTQPLLPTLIAAFAAAAKAAALLPLQLSTFSLYSSHSHTSLTFCSLTVPFYRQQWCCSTCSFVNKGGCQLQLFFNNGSCTQQPSLTMAMAAILFQKIGCRCCHISGNIPTIRSKKFDRECRLQRLPIFLDCSFGAYIVSSHSAIAELFAKKVMELKPHIPTKTLIPTAK